MRSLSEQVALETRTRTLNPKWYEGLLAYGYEGVRQIEAHVTNTMGWSATTNQVEPWVYEQISRPSCSTRKCANVSASSIRPHRRSLQTGCSKPTSAATGSPDAETLAALRDAGDELEDRLEGVEAEIAA